MIREHAVRPFITSVPLLSSLSSPSPISISSTSLGRPETIKWIICDTLHRQTGCQCPRESNILFHNRPRLRGYVHGNGAGPETGSAPDYVQILIRVSSLGQTHQHTQNTRTRTQVHTHILSPTPTRTKTASLLPKLARARPRCMQAPTLGPSLQQVPARIHANSDWESSVRFYVQKSCALSKKARAGRYRCGQKKERKSF